MKKGEDPYLIHYYKINFDGSNLVELTPEEGMHQCWYSSDYKYLVDVYSKVDQAPIAVLRDAKDGKSVCSWIKPIFLLCWPMAGKPRKYFQPKVVTENGYVGSDLSPV